MTDKPDMERARETAERICGDDGSFGDLARAHLALVRAARTMATNTCAHTYPAEDCAACAKIDAVRALVASDIYGENGNGT